MSNDVELLRVHREQIGPRRWQVEIALPDDDPDMVGAGSGSSNNPGEPHTRLVVYGRTAANLKRLSELLAEAADLVEVIG